MLKKMKMRENYNKENRMKKISYSILKELIDNIKDDEEIVIDENGIKMDAVYFGEAQEFVDFVQAHDTISVTYYPEINVFQGRENLQVVIKNYC